MTVFRASVGTVPGTEAAEGRAGGQEDRPVRVDRPAGVAGGTGEGLNGAQLLALAVGGCLANDVRYAAHELDVRVDDVRVEVELTVDEGRVTGAEVSVDVSGGPGAGTAVDRALAVSIVLAAVRSGFPVETVDRVAGPEDRTDRADRAGRADRPGRIAPDPAWVRRRRREQVFGDVLPETTADERPAAVEPAGTGDDWLRSQVPPHHGG